MTTLATVGYGDVHAVNVYETMWATFYMFSNLALTAYVLGSITLIVLKGDERVGRFRDRSNNLKAYSIANDIPPVGRAPPSYDHSCSDRLM